MGNAEIAIRITALLGQFWTEDSPDEIRALEIEGWLDTLRSAAGTIAEREWRDAWAEYQQSGPRSGGGRLLKPDAGAIAYLITKRRGPVRRDRMPEALAAPQREVVSAERRKAIMAEVWGDAPPVMAPKPFPEVGDGHE